MAANGGNLLALGQSRRRAAGEQLFTMNHNAAKGSKKGEIGLLTGGL
jgi:hypothetical protein